ncbi:lipocalin family protein [Streptomyces sp. NPDC013178]|uniref:lipocalin family protein n=1 Tax=Streptomyces sp. NPDC013178 TaxID=3155118 RepID=UPI0033F585F9
MKKSTCVKAGITAAALTAAALLGGTVIPAAQAAGQEGSASPATTNAGIPATVDPDTDLAAHTPGKETLWNDSIYFTSSVKAGGHDFGVLVHTIHFPNADKRALAVSVTDKTTGWYKKHEAAYTKDDYAWSTGGLDIRTPDLTWTGNAHTMHIEANTPWGSLKLQFTAKGPALKYAGTGSFPLLGDLQYEFALPALDTTGSLTVNGTTHKVSGETWLDRQWGPVSLADPTMHWTWMNLSLPNGDKLAIWDAVNSKEENAWATVLHPDGSYDLAAVKPLAEDAHRFWTSPTSGNSYPTRWRVEIPSLKTRLSVRITGTDGQELTGGFGVSRMEATASFTGTYQGKKVSGENYVEMPGNWKR